MDPMQVVLLGGGGVTVVVGIVKSIRGPKPGTAMGVRTHQDEIALCAVCGREAEEYDDARKRWVCGLHIPGVVQSVRQVPSHGAERKKQLPPLQKTQTQRPRVHIDPHDMETIRDERQLRQVQVRQPLLDDYEEDYDEEEEELCTHGRDPERCRACYQIEQARNARSVQRRPVQQLPVRQPKRVEVPDTLEVVIEIVQKYPRINEAQLADMLEAYPEDVRPFLAAAREELGIVLRRPGRSARKEKEYR